MDFSNDTEKLFYETCAKGDVSSATLTCQRGYDGVAFGPHTGILTTTNLLHSFCYS